MNTTYVTHGRKYHLDPKCPRMIHGEELHDWEGDDGWGGFTSGSYRREDPNPQYAAACGKLPCLHCVPAEHRVFPPLYGQTFGHEPTYMDLGSCGMGGCQCPGHYDAEVCARCVIVEYETSEQLVTDEHGNDQYVHGRWVVRRDPVLWPCTSAIVLGLAPRPAPAA